MSAPIKEFSAGKTRCAVFQNESNGRIFYSFKFSKSYMDKEKNWQNTDNFYDTDLRDLKILVDYLCAKQVKERTPKAQAQPEPQPEPQMGTPEAELPF